MNEQLPLNPTPAELAESVAMNLMMKGVYDDNEYVRYEFEQIEHLASKAYELELVDKKYIVKAGRSLLMPARFNPEEEVSMI